MARIHTFAALASDGVSSTSSVAPRRRDLIDTLRDGGQWHGWSHRGSIVEPDLRALHLRALSLFGCTHQPANVFTDLAGYIEAARSVP